MKLFARRGYEWAEDGLVGLWSPVNTGATGLAVVDGSGVANHGATENYLSESAPWAGSPVGTVLQFASSTRQRVAIANSSDFLINSTSGDFSISAWVLATATLPTYAPIFTNWTTGFSSRFFFGFVGQNIAMFDAAGNAPLRDTATVPLNVWKHYCFVRERNVGYLYGDGKLITTASFAVNFIQSTPYIGATGANTGTDIFAPGRIAEVAFHRSALQRANVEAAFQANPGGMWQLSPQRPRSYFGTSGNRRRRLICGANC